MTRKKAGGLFRLLAAGAALLTAAVLPVSAAMPLGYSKHALSVVTVPGKSSQYAEYYKDGKQQAASAMPWVEDDRRGKVLSLSGQNEYLQVTSEPLPLMKSTFTAWVNWEQQGDEEPVLFSMSSRITADRLTLSLRHTDDERGIDGVYLHFYHVDGTLIEWFNPVSDGVAYPIPENEWHHLALTVDGQYFRLYIDGRLWFEKMLIMGLVELRANRLYIGTTGEEGAPTLKAKLADVRLYDSAMTGEQVVRAMETGENPFDSSATGTAAATTLYHPTEPPTTTAAAQTTASDGPIVIGGFPLSTLVIMGGIVLLFVALSVGLSLYRKRGDRP